MLLQSSMRTRPTRRLRPWLLLRLGAAALALAGLGPSLSVRAQADAAQPPAEAQPESAVELDLAQLVFEGVSLRVNDPVWSLRPTAGRRLVVLPLRIRPVQQTTELQRSPVSVRFGRFVGFYIPEADAQHAGRNAAMPLGAAAHEDQAFVDRLLGPDPAEAGHDAAAAAPDEEILPAEPDDAGEPAADGSGKPVPDFAPRLSRSLTLEPDGTIRWEMERTLHAAELSGASEAKPYGYKISPEKLREQQPDRPERVERRSGEDGREYAQRRREALQKQREEQTAFRELRRMVLDLPTEFHAPAPEAVYVVYEAPERDAVEIDGPAPLPWTLTDEQRERYQQLERTRPGEPEANQLLLNLATQADRHPYDARAIALAAARGGLVGSVEPEDAGDTLLRALIRSKDPVARRITLLAAARAQPPTPAAIGLLREGTEQTTGAVRQALQLTALSRLLAMNQGDADQQAQVVARVNELLAADDGPAARQVVQALLGSAGDTLGHAATQPPSVLIEQVRFNAVSDDEAPAVVEAVVKAAPTNALAAGWLGNQLLAPDSKHLARTLKALDTHRPAPTPDDGAQAEADSDTAQPALDPAYGQAPNEPTTIPIDAADHGLVLALSSEDAQVRDSAWAVLDRFHVAAAARAPAEAGEEAVPTSAELFETIVERATAQPTTPTTLIGFIEGQVEPTLARDSSSRVLRLLGEPGVSAAVKKRVADRVLGASAEGEPIQALRALEPEALAGVVMGLYEAQGVEAPLSAGLLAAERGTLREWLIARLSANALPEAEAWGERLMREGGLSDRLLRLAAGERVLVVRAAGAALVAMNGGNRAEQQRFATLLEEMDERTGEKVQAAWSAYRQTVLARVFGEAQGAYRVTVAVYEQAKTERGSPEPGVEADDPAPAKREPTQRLAVGLVRLDAAGAALKLSVEGVELTVPEDRLAIRIAKPGSLTQLDATSLEGVGLDEASGPLDLLPTESGAWSGEVSLPGGGAVAVTLTPAE